MALDSLTAKANEGDGTDVLAGRTVGGKFVGAAMLTDETGAEISAANPLDVTFSALKAEDTAAASGDLGLPLLAMRQSADTTSTDADGDYTLLKVDEEGRLKVGSKPASYPDITGDITTTQPVISTPVAGGTVEGDVSRASNLMIFCTGTFSTINCTFEGSLEASGASNWFAVQAVRSNANTIELTTGNLSAQPAYAWELSVNAFRRFRVRATAWGSGTQSWRFVQGTYATEPIPAAQASALTASNARAGQFVANGVWYDDSSSTLAGAATFTGTSRDVTGGTLASFPWASTTNMSQETVVSAESDVTGTLWIEASRDNTNWRRVKSTATAAVAGGGFYAEIIHRPSWRYLRVGYTNGAGAQARFTIGTFMKAA